MAYLTLTEAMTEIADGARLRAEDYVARRLRSEVERQEGWMISARHRSAALKAAGLEPSDYALSDPNMLILGHLPEVASHLTLSIQQAACRDHEAEKLWSAGRDIIARGAAGNLTILGRPEGRGMLEEIRTAELFHAAFEENVGLDILYIRESSFFWTQVTVDEPMFADWQHERKKTLSLPTIGAENKAIFIAKEALQTTPALTKRQVRDILDSANIAYSGIGFDTRIWPSARKAAGLPHKAKSGRPSRREKN